jgi:hypothetical protein
MSAQITKSSWWLALGAALALVLGGIGAGCGSDYVDPVDGGPDDEGQDDGDIYHYSLFDCPQSVEQPAEVITYRDVNKFAKFYQDVYAIVEPWIDESCFEPCADFDGYDECTTASCVTADGATLEYELKYKSEEFESDSWEEVTTLSLVPPEGTAWTSVEIHAVESGYGDTEYGGQTLSFSIEWAGEMGTDWPVDLAVTGERFSEFDDGGNSAGGNWHHPGCDIVVYRNKPAAGLWSTSIVANGIDVEVNAAPDQWDPVGLNGYVEGECLGEVAEDGWILIGDCL